MLTPEGHVQQPPIPVRPPSQAYVRNSVVSNSGLPVGFVPVSVTPTASPVLFDTTSGSGPTGEVPLGFIPAGVPVAFPDGITTVASPTRSNNLEHSQSRHSLHSRHGSTHSLSSSLRRVGPNPTIDKQPAPSKYRGSASTISHGQHNTCQSGIDIWSSYWSCTEQEPF